MTTLLHVVEILDTVSMWMGAHDVEAMMSACRELRRAGIGAQNVWARFCVEDRLLGLSRTRESHIQLLHSLGCCLRCLYWQCSPLRISATPCDREGYAKCTPRVYPRYYHPIGGSITGAVTVISPMGLCQKHCAKNERQTGCSWSSSS